MNKINVNNIYNTNGKTLDEIIDNFITCFLDNDLNCLDFSVTTLNDCMVENE